MSVHTSSIQSSLFHSKPREENQFWKPPVTNSKSRLGYFGHIVIEPQPENESFTSFSAGVTAPLLLCQCGHPVHVLLKDVPLKSGLKTGNLYNTYPFCNVSSTKCFLLEGIRYLLAVKEKEMSKKQNKDFQQVTCDFLEGIFSFHNNFSDPENCCHPKTSSPVKKVWEAQVQENKVDSSPMINSEVEEMKNFNFHNSDKGVRDADMVAPERPVPKCRTPLGIFEEETVADILSHFNELRNLSSHSGTINISSAHSDSNSTARITCSDFEDTVFDDRTAFDNIPCSPDSMLYLDTDHLENDELIQERLSRTVSRDSTPLMLSPCDSQISETFFDISELGSETKPVMNSVFVDDNTTSSLPHLPPEASVLSENAVLIKSEIKSPVLIKQEVETPVLEMTESDHSHVAKTKGGSTLRIKTETSDCNTFGENVNSGKQSSPLEFISSVKNLIKESKLKATNSGSLQKESSDTSAKASGYAKDLKLNSSSMCFKKHPKVVLKRLTRKQIRIYTKQRKTKSFKNKKPKGKKRQDYGTPDERSGMKKKKAKCKPQLSYPHISTKAVAMYPDSPTHDKKETEQFGQQLSSKSKEIESIGLLHGTKSKNTIRSEDELQTTGPTELRTTVKKKKKPKMNLDEVHTGDKKHSTKLQKIRDDSKKTKKNNLARSDLMDSSDIVNRVIKEHDCRKDASNVAVERKGKAPDQEDEIEKSEQVQRRNLETDNLLKSKSKNVQDNSSFNLNSSGDLIMKKGLITSKEKKQIVPQKSNNVQCSSISKKDVLGKTLLEFKKKDAEDNLKLIDMFENGNEKVTDIVKSLKAKKKLKKKLWKIIEKENPLLSTTSEEEQDAKKKRKKEKKRKRQLNLSDNDEVPKKKVKKCRIDDMIGSSQSMEWEKIKKDKKKKKKHREKDGKSKKHRKHEQEPDKTEAAEKTCHKPLIQDIHSNISLASVGCAVSTKESAECLPNYKSSSECENTVTEDRSVVQHNENHEDIASHCTESAVSDSESNVLTSSDYQITESRETVEKSVNPCSHMNLSVQSSIELENSDKIAFSVNTSEQRSAATLNEYKKNINHGGIESVVDSLNEDEKNIATCTTSRTNERVVLGEDVSQPTENCTESSFMCEHKEHNVYSETVELKDDKNHSDNHENASAPISVIDRSSFPFKDVSNNLDQNKGSKVPEPKECIDSTKKGVTGYPSHVNESKCKEKNNGTCVQSNLKIKFGDETKSGILSEVPKKAVSFSDSLTKVYNFSTSPPIRKSKVVTNTNGNVSENSEQSKSIKSSVCQVKKGNQEIKPSSIGLANTVTGKKPLSSSNITSRDVDNMLEKALQGKASKKAEKPDGHWELHSFVKVTKMRYSETLPAHVISVIVEARSNSNSLQASLSEDPRIQSYLGTYKYIEWKKDIPITNKKPGRTEKEKSVESSGKVRDKNNTTKSINQSRTTDKEKSSVPSGKIRDKSRPVVLSKKPKVREEHSKCSAEKESKSRLEKVTYKSPDSTTADPESPNLRQNLVKDVYIPGLNLELSSGITNEELNIIENNMKSMKDFLQENDSVGKEEFSPNYPETECHEQPYHNTIRVEKHQTVNNKAFTNCLELQTSTCNMMSKETNVETNANANRCHDFYSTQNSSEHQFFPQPIHSDRPFHQEIRQDMVVHGNPFCNVNQESTLYMSQDGHQRSCPPYQQFTQNHLYARDTVAHENTFRNVNQQSELCTANVASYPAVYTSPNSVQQNFLQQPLPNSGLNSQYMINNVLQNQTDVRNQTVHENGLHNVAQEIGLMKMQEAIPETTKPVQTDYPMEKDDLEDPGWENHRNANLSTEEEQFAFIRSKWRENTREPLTREYSVQNYRRKRLAIIDYIKTGNLSRKRRAEDDLWFLSQQPPNKTMKAIPSTFMQDSKLEANYSEFMKHLSALKSKSFSQLSKLQTEYENDCLDLQNRLKERDKNSSARDCSENLFASKETLDKKLEENVKALELSFQNRYNTLFNSFFQERRVVEEIKSEILQFDRFCGSASETNLCPEQKKTILLVNDLINGFKNVYPDTE